MKWTKWSLKSKIILPIILLNVLVFISQIIVFKYSINKSLNSEYRSKGRAIAEALSYSAQQTLLNRDASTVQGFIDQYREIEGVEYIYIRNEEGRVTAHTFTPRVPKEILSQISETSEEVDGKLLITTWQFQGRDTIDIKAPVLAGLLGAVHVGMGSEKQQEKVILPLILRSLLLTTIFAVVGVLISTFVLSLSIRPIISLTRGIKEILKNKNMHLRIDKKSDDEVGELTESFNEMLGTLNEHTKNLERLVEEKTKNIENQQKVLLHTAKLASIGELAAGVGHEINNPLAIVVGNVEFLKINLNEIGVKEESVFRRISKIEEGSDRIRKIVDGLRTYARSDGNDSEAVSLNSVVDLTINLIDEIYEKDGVFLKKNMPKDELFTLGEKGKLQQVFMNLLSNAKDAMRECEKKEIEIFLRQKEGKILLSVSDTGIGMTEEVLSKIFDPFFTTKQIGEGTGMGLGVVNEVLAKMDGTIEVVSKPGVGTKFTICLPLIEKDALVKNTDSLKKEDEIALVGSALVVDDEVEIRCLLIDCLRGLGLQAIDEAENGEEALEKIKIKKYDYICTDMKMPKMSGDQLIMAAKDLPNGAAKYFIVTGGVEASLSEEEFSKVKEHISGFLMKPFDLKSVREILSSGNNA